jgi:predicted component of type VI protein secretion system
MAESGSRGGEQIRTYYKSLLASAVESYNEFFDVLEKYEQALLLKDFEKLEKYSEMMGGMFAKIEANNKVRRDLGALFTAASANADGTHDSEVAAQSALAAGLAQKMRQNIDRLMKETAHRMHSYKLELAALRTYGLPPTRKAYRYSDSENASMLDIKG